jgi:hypothetical protein
MLILSPRMRTDYLIIRERPLSFKVSIKVFKLIGGSYMPMYFRITSCAPGYPASLWVETYDFKVSTRAKG